MTASRGACLICLRDLGPDRAAYHAKCLKDLFGTTRAPDVEATLAEVENLGLRMVRFTCLSGVQRKLAMDLSADRRRLVLAPGSGNFILKPQSNLFAALPENEHLTMQLGRLSGLETPPNGLVTLPDGTTAYVVKRFDRAADGHKNKLEDFCQLADMPPKDKYDGSGERCARLIQRFASAPLVDLARFYRLVLFSWWCGNEDLHRKNLALLGERKGEYRLSPAFDLVASRLYLPDRDLALPINRKDRNLTRRDWLTFAQTCGLPDRAAATIRDEVAGTLPAALQAVSRSYLPDPFKDRYALLLDARTRVLVGAGR